jgi:hypothetical protein
MHGQSNLLMPDTSCRAIIKLLGYVKADLDCTAEDCLRCQPATLLASRLPAHQLPASAEGYSMGIGGHPQAAATAKNCRVLPAAYPTRHVKQVR